MTEHELSEIFVAWFLWRCYKGEILSRWTRAVAEDIMEKRGLVVDEMAEKYGFYDGMWDEFKPKGLFPNG